MKRKRRMNIWPPLLAGLLILVLIGLAAMMIVWRMNVYALEMQLLGDRELVLEYGAVFEDPGAEASFSGSLLLRDSQDIPVRVQGTVDTSTVGTYTLTYEARVVYQDLFWEREESKTADRVVRVVDTQAPQITLTHQNDYYTLPGQPYVEEGFLAVDGYDGDLTDRVVVTVLSDHVRYEVTDSSGNRTEITRVILFKDPVAPELHLKGESSMTLTEGDSFADPGCNAYDNCDGDLTQKVQVSGSVDPSRPGTYTLTYTVTDTYGNTSSTTRTVTVAEKPAPPPTEPPATEPPTTEPLPEIPTEQMPSNGKVIYLTFDDGPGPHTARLLDILKKYNVQATFFVVGNSDYLSLLPRMAQEGHVVAMHTYSHKYATVYASDDAYFADLKKVQDIIFDYTGQTANVLRFPGGSSNTISRDYSRGIMTRLTQKVEEMGYRYFDWNVDSNDAGGAKSSDEVYRNVVNGIKNRKNSVVLQHDVKGFSVDAVERIIQWGLASGYTFGTLNTDSPECEHGVNN